MLKILPGSAGVNDLRPKVFTKFCAEIGDMLSGTKFAGEEASSHVTFSSLANFPNQSLALAKNSDTMASSSRFKERALSELEPGALKLVDSHSLALTGSA